MKTKIIDISKFTLNKAFYGEIDLLITIKSFNLQAIRKRYLESKKNKNKRTGSVERRAVTEGGLASIKIKNGRIHEETVLGKFPEPRGIDYLNGILAFSSENKLYIIKNQKLYTISNPWFSYIHTCKINPFDNAKVLVSSSGFDCIFEYDYIQNTQTFEWFAWENGFEFGIDPETGDRIYLSRSKEKAAEYKNKGLNHLLIDATKDSFLPTSKRAAFINSVVYNPKDKNQIIATFFHEGTVYAIDRESGKTTALLQGLLNPHGGNIHANKTIATSTKSGEVFIKTEEEELRYQFKNLPEKKPELGDFEWIQNAIFLDGNIIAIDSNRNAFIIFNTEKECYDSISFNDNWAIQDLIDVSDFTEQQIEEIKAIS
jgi:hypothetical protein